MSKGLKLTLLTVAVALMGMYAMAEAPVVSEIPTVIIGGGTAGSTPPDVFVYPDALDMSDYVTDPDGTDAGIVWSYDVIGTAKYSFNGVDPLGGGDPITPGALEINTQVLQSEYDNDTDADTVTIRNIRLSPFSGTGETPDPPGALFDSQVVTLWASDGATATQGEVMIWTDNEGEDRLSGVTIPTGIQILDIDLSNNTPGWATTGIGGATMTAGASGVCVEVAEGGVNIGWYSSDIGFADLVDNAVYQIQMTVTSSQATAGLGPLWDVIIDNFSDDQQTGGNAYFYDALFLDNEGAANAAAAGSIGRSDFEVWFTPASVNLASWRDTSTGAFSSANDPHNDMRFQFRVLDGDATSGYGGELDVGQICLAGVVGYRYDITAVNAGAAVYNDAMTDANIYQHDLLGNTAFTFDASGLTVGPSATDWGTDISYVECGDGDIAGDPTDDYPIPWDTADQLYMVEVAMKAADAASAASPPDVIQIGMDVGTNELIQLNGITAGGRDLNKIATPQETSGTFVAFFYSHTPSLTLATNYKRMRPRIQILNSTTLNFEGQTTAEGDIVIESWSVKPVSFD